MGRWAADAARRYAPDADASQRSALIRRLQAAGATQGLPVLQAWATERATRPGAMRNPWAVLWHRFARLGVQLDRLPARGARP